jgi:hypothetical protein
MIDVVSPLVYFLILNFVDLGCRSIRILFPNMFSFIAIYSEFTSTILLYEYNLHQAQEILPWAYESNPLQALVTDMFNSDYHLR